MMFIGGNLSHCTHEANTAGIILYAPTRYSRPTATHYELSVLRPLTNPLTGTEGPTGYLSNPVTSQVSYMTYSIFVVQPIATSDLDCHLHTY